MMNAAVYDEPQKFSAGLLAVAVHLVFFSALYFGVNWRVTQPQSLAVEAWSQLPDPVLEVVPVPVMPEEVPKTELPPKVLEPVIQPKMDIELKDKKKKKSKEEEKLAASKLKQEELVKQQAVQKKLAEEKRASRESERVSELQAKMRAEMDAATQGEVLRFTDMIRAKVSRNIVMPPDVPATAEAKFLVIVLPGGSVVDVQLKKNSGHSAYDSAVERAIYKAQPLPMPSDPALARVFRELRLSFKP